MLALALAILAWALLFFPQLFLGRVFVLGDAAAYRPYAEFSRARWHDERVRTYWNPYTFLGLEAVASLADSRPQYLPDPLLTLVERFSQPRFSPQLWLLLVHLAGTLAVMALARALWRASAWAALCGGLVWLLSVPLLLPLAFGHDAQLVADALIPIAMLCTVHVIRAQDSPSTGLAMAGLSATLAIQILHGHPQVVVYSGMLLIAFAAQQSIARASAARAGLWVLSAGLGVAMATAAWWPALLYSAQSFRGGGDTPGMSLAEVAQFSLGWRDLLSLFWPQAVGYGGASYWGAMKATDYSPFLGAVALLLALRGRGRGGQDRSTAPLLWSVLILSGLLSLGTHLGPVFGFLRAQIPFWSRFRVPSLVLVLGVLSLALLAARGAARMQDAPAAGRRVRPRTVVAVVLATLAGLALLGGPVRDLYATLARTLHPQIEPAAAAAAARGAGLDLLVRLVLLVVAGATLSRRFPRMGALAGAGMLLGLVAADIGMVSVPALARATGRASAVEAPPPTLLAEVAARHPSLRAYVGVAGRMPEGYFEAYTNYWVRWRARCLTGLHGSAPDSWRRVMRHDLTRRGAALRAWGVGYIDLPSEVPFDTASLAPVAERDGIRVLAFRHALGRAYAVRHVVAVRDEDAMARSMALPGFDPAVAAVVTAQEAAGEYPGSERCSIRWLRDEPEHLLLEVNTPQRAFVVVADSHFPGWSATLDDRATALLKTNVLVRGVVVPPGRHRLAMRYQTAGMMEGVAVTRLGLLVWGVLAAFSLSVRARRRQSGGASGNDRGRSPQAPPSR